MQLDPLDSLDHLEREVSQVHQASLETLVLQDLMVSRRRVLRE